MAPGNGWFWITGFVRQNSLGRATRRQALLRGAFRFDFSLPRAVCPYDATGRKREMPGVWGQGPPRAGGLVCD
jgi:hypothetical protein